MFLQRLFGAPSPAGGAAGLSPANGRPGHPSLCLLLLQDGRDGVRAAAGPGEEQDAA